ncbi:uncharacterized protein LOC128198268 [Bicyclus anynana]|uniref:Uncharacterized protein LOC128198268 n=1 Tax=Bicyclus anynana TaxID=110368 RepID=A0ABM3LHN2_BICAN|nr:uncharacterized protein LOC128198268 [Bicyclus anynana]
MRSEHKSTREGPLRGESLGASDSRRIGPSVYGGANRRIEARLERMREEERTGNAQRGESLSMELERDINVVEDLIENRMDATSCASDSDRSSVRPATKQSSSVKRRRLSNGGESTSEAEEVASQNISSRRKGPCTKKEMFLKPVRATDDGEEHIQELARAARMARSSIGLPTVADNEVLMKRVEDDINIIVKVATKSKNLKGTFQKALKDAGASIKETVEALKDKMSSEEVTRLQLENAALRKELKQIRKDMAELRMEERRTNSCYTPSTQTSAPEQTKEPAPSSTFDSQAVDELSRSIMIQVGTMIDARLHLLEQRLPPEERIRPPLSTDRRTSANDASASTSGAPQTRPKPREEATAPKTKKGNVRKTGTGTKPVDKSESAPQPSGSTQNEEEWTKVGKSGKKSKTSANSSKPSVKKLRLARSAAVVITLQPGATDKAVTYASILSEAKSKIDLSSIGISALRFRRAATGARILELPGESGGKQADTLAQSLRQILPDEIVRVSRPEKCVNLRITGLDDSVNEAEIAAAVSVKGGCPIEAVKVGKIQWIPKSTGSVLIRCPVAAAKKMEEGRLLVGWVSANVRLLEQRPLRCFRCLETGHVRPMCTAEIDRSSECYNCGQPGHKAADCSSNSNCSLCAAAGGPANHKLGGGLCQNGKKSKKAWVRPQRTVQTDCPSVNTGESLGDGGNRMAED